MTHEQIKAAMRAGYPSFSEARLLDYEEMAMYCWNLTAMGATNETLVWALERWLLPKGGSVQINGEQQPAVDQRPHVVLAHAQMLRDLGHGERPGALVDSGGGRAHT